MHVCVCNSVSAAQTYVACTVMACRQCTVLSVDTGGELGHKSKHRPHLQAQAVFIGQLRGIVSRVVVRASVGPSSFLVLWYVSASIP